MSIILNLLMFVATGLLFYKLVTTNHWTTGKKNLVAVVGCLLWKSLVKALYLFSLLPVLSLTAVDLIANLPLAIAMCFITVMVMWTNE